MSGSLMLKALYAKQDGRAPVLLVDCGYMSEATSIAAWDALRAAGLPKSRFRVEGHNRLLAELPPRKASAILAANPILEGGRYWQTTHRWEGVQ